MADMASTLALSLTTGVTVLVHHLKPLHLPTLVPDQKHQRLQLTPTATQRPPLQQQHQQQAAAKAMAATRDLVAAAATIISVTGRCHL
jgi:hypothetical protein